MEDATFRYNVHRVAYTAWSSQDSEMYSTGM